jgi:hypothetical protein
VAPRSLVATWTGRCRTCKADTLERIVLELPSIPPRPLSPAELADPALRARRESIAAELAADGRAAETIVRDYLEPRVPVGAPAPTSTGPGPTPIGSELDKLRRRRC